MFRHHSCCMEMIFQHARKFQVRSAEAEIHRGFLGVLDELSQIVAFPEPRENAVPVPTPRDDLLTREVGGEMPAVFLGKLFDAAMQPVVVPAESDEDAFLIVGHWSCC